MCYRSRHWHHSLLLGVLTIVCALPTCLAQNFVARTLLSRPPDNDNAAQHYAIKTAQLVETLPAPSHPLLFARANAYITNANFFDNREAVLSEAFERLKTGATPFNKTEVPVTKKRIDPSYALKVAHPISNPNDGDLAKPLDNVVAVSPKGFVVSLSNSTYNYFKSTGGPPVTSSLLDFFRGKVSSPCDPKVIFDYDTQRFIVFAQSLDPSYNSSILGLAFSKSEDPKDGWNIYLLDGNIRSKVHECFDFPKLSVSSDGIFLSGNLYNKDDYQESILIQIEKRPGTLGQPLHYVAWDRFSDNPFVLVPVRYGFEGSYGPGNFLVSTKFMEQKDNPNEFNSETVYLYEVQGNIFTEGATIRSYSIKTNPFYPFLRGVQRSQDPNGTAIDNSDVRIQDGFFADDKLFFVFTSGNKGLSKINFNILDLKTCINTSQLIGDKPDYNYCYPSIAPLSDPGDANIKSVLVYNGSSLSSYVSIFATLVDETLSTSPEYLVKEGEGTTQAAVDDLGNIYHRLGDYTTVSRRPGTNENWLIASYPDKTGLLHTFLGGILLENTPAAASFANQAVPEAARLRFQLNEDIQQIKVSLKASGSDQETILYKGPAEKGVNFVNYNSMVTKGGKYLIRIRNARNELIRAVHLNKNKVIKK